MRLACEYVGTLWPKAGMEVETDFRIVRYRPLPGEEYTAEIVAKGEGLPEHNFFEIALEGKMVSDPQYGDTFLVSSFETKVKRTRANILGYFASGAVKGVGPAVAKRIVEHFGEDALNILEQDPSRLREVSGIGEKVLQEMVGSFEAHREINALMLYVGQYYGEALSGELPAKSPMTINKAKRIVDHFGSRALEIVKSDIYHLCEVDGFGFVTVDAMAERMRQPMNTLGHLRHPSLRSHRTGSQTALRGHRLPRLHLHKAFGLWSEDDKEAGGAEQKLDLVILDESSMLDMWLAAQVITRIAPETKLVLVGDAAQLPSVGPGNVLHEVIQSGEVPTVQLKTVFRQAEGSSIAINAQLIERAETELVFDDDFVFLPAKNQEEAMYLICALYQRAVQAVGRDKVQILTPVRKDGHACGVNSLNTAIQGMMQDEPGAGCHHYGRFFCIGDPVIQNRNADGIYNGEVGVVQEAEPDKIQVRFTGSDKDLPYGDDKLNLLDLAYALTVHKSQGSEYSVVIFPVLKEHKFMLNRNLLYTAITRGKTRVFLVGNRWALNYAIYTEDTSKRRTALAFRIRESCRKLREAAENVRQMPAA